MNPSATGSLTTTTHSESGRSKHKRHSIEIQLARLGVFVCRILPSSPEPSSFRSVLILASAYKHLRTLIDCAALLFSRSRQPFTHCRTAGCCCFVFFWSAVLFLLDLVDRFPQLSMIRVLRAFVTVVAVVTDAKIAASSSLING